MSDSRSCHCTVVVSLVTLVPVIKRLLRLESVSSARIQVKHLTSRRVRSGVWVSAVLLAGVYIVGPEHEEGHAANGHNARQYPVHPPATCAGVRQEEA
eukprot:6468198-Amphidinium_carterae.1